MDTNNETQVGFIPSGSYQQTCKDISITLTALLEDANGNFGNPQSLDLTTLKNPDVWNSNGSFQIVPQGQAPQNYFQPGGSWSQTAVNAQVMLTCQAMTNSGHYVSASFDLTQVQAADLHNDDGVLKNAAS